jgi:hypothetical protein
MPQAPLTHHDILELVRPFSRRGRHVDLAASDRLERRLVFRPVDHAAGPGDASVLREVLQLEQLPTGTFRLTRLLNDSSGLEASLCALGARPEDLLTAFQALEPHHHFRAGPHFRIARSYELPTVRGSPGREAAAPFIFTRGVARIGDLSVTLLLPATRGVAANIEVRTLPGHDPLDPPEDLLAVLGWDWVRLVPDGDGWTSKLRLRGNAQRRTLGAERALETLAGHLAHTLMEPPCRFHERWVAARWSVVLRRIIPLLALVLLVLLTAVLPHVVPHPKPGLQVLIFDLPVVLIAISFCLQEHARYEIPPRPRRSRADSWRRPPRA